MGETIRLSDRLELVPVGHPDNPASDPMLRVDGSIGFVLVGSSADALIAACNPPRYDLPPGVIAGSDGKFYAPGEAVRTLPDDMWTAWWADGTERTGTNLGASTGFFYEVRPTAANPTPTLPDYTFRLPDGELACYRRDATKLREAGAGLRQMNGDIALPQFDHERPNMVLLVEFPPTPKTERVQIEGPYSTNGGQWRVGIDGDNMSAHFDLPSKAVAEELVRRMVDGDDFGTVEVLLTDTDR